MRRASKGRPFWVIEMNSYRAKWITLNNMHVHDAANMKKIAGKYRAQAQLHFAAAEKLLEANDDSSGRYACIELRMSIEAVCYGLLCLYLPELSKSKATVWQPKKVLDELLEIDKHVTTPRTLSIQDPKSGEWVDIGTTDYRFSVKWARKAHNALGNALHVPTVDQLVKNEESSPSDFRQRCDEYISQLRQVLDSQSWHITMTGPGWKIRCDCGFEMHRRTENIEIGSEIICSSCGRIYEVARISEDKIDVELRKLRWKCLKCGDENGTPEFELVENVITNCRTCKEQTKMRKVWGMFQQEPASESKSP